MTTKMTSLKTHASIAIIMKDILVDILYVPRDEMETAYEITTRTHVKNMFYDMIKKDFNTFPVKSEDGSRDQAEIKKTNFNCEEKAKENGFTDGDDGDFDGVFTNCFGRFEFLVNKFRKTIKKSHKTICSLNTMIPPLIRKSVCFIEDKTLTDDEFIESYASYLTELALSPTFTHTFADNDCINGNSYRGVSVVSEYTNHLPFGGFHSKST